LLAVRLPFSPDYVGPELENLGASLERTLRAEFATTTILPDYDVLYLASDVAPPAAPEEWIARSAARGLRNDFAVPPAIAERLTTDRIGQVRAAFAANRTAQINRDERPIACAYVGAYWLRAHHPGAAAFATRLAEARWPWGAAGAALAAAGMAWATRGRRTRRIGPWALGIGSFSLMAIEMILLLAFQSFCGYLYHWLALILAALMLGMAAGDGAGRARESSRAGGASWIARAGVRRTRVFPARLGGAGRMGDGARRRMDFPGVGGAGRRRGGCGISGGESRLCRECGGRRGSGGRRLCRGSRGILPRRIVDKSLVVAGVRDGADAGDSGRTEHRRGVHRGTPD
jgi:hypothetical protein